MFDTVSIESLKEGDEAVIVSYGNSSINYRATKVAKVTPSGRVKTTTGEEFNSDGRQRGKRYGPQLRPMTDEIRDEIADRIERTKLLNTIDDWAHYREYRSLPTADLRRVAELIAEIDRVRALLAAERAKG